MANPYFKFKQFTVWHDRCAMKVGTDGVLLGAWAEGGERVLDIGTGTGLLALMMAQRFPHAHVTAVEIDHEAAAQAADNIRLSPFADRMTVVDDDVCVFADNCNLKGVFDAIVCNPPYFVRSLKNPDSRRAVARHADGLPFSRLFSVASNLLSPGGRFSLILPADLKAEAEKAAFASGLYLSECCGVKTNRNKLVKRYLLQFSKEKVDGVSSQTVVLESSPGIRSEWYASVTSGFYL